MQCSQRAAASIVNVEMEQRLEKLEKLQAAIDKEKEARR